MRPSVGLMGRILTVLLLTVLFEFGASTLLYERASGFSWREDEARRLAEHLVIARKLLAERPPAERSAIARELTTDRYDISWSQTAPPPDPVALPSELVETQGDIVAWEPSLRVTGLRLSLAPSHHRSMLVGGLLLPDRSWMYFAAHPARHDIGLTVGRILIALVPTAVLLIVGGLLIRRMFRPLQHLEQATAMIGASAPVLLPEEGTEEVRGLIRSFNAMQGRIHRLVEDRIQALAAVGHDLRTPLARIQLRLDGVAEAAVREEIGEDVAEIEAMVASLLAFIGGEDDPEPPQAIDLAVLTATIVERFEDEGKAATYAGPEHLRATVRPMAMRRAITNLIENALHYGGRAGVTLTAAAGTVRIAVEDDGSGIPPESLESVLAPFVRLDAARGRNVKGLGLGLAIVQRAVEREGGTLRLENRLEGGLRAEIIL